MNYVKMAYNMSQDAIKRVAKIENDKKILYCNVGFDVNETATFSTTKSLKNLLMQCLVETPIYLELSARVSATMLTSAKVMFYLDDALVSEKNVGFVQGENEYEFSCNLPNVSIGKHIINIKIELLQVTEVTLKTYSVVAFGNEIKENFMDMMIKSVSTGADEYVAIKENKNIVIYSQNNNQAVFTLAGVEKFDFIHLKQFNQANYEFTNTNNFIFTVVDSKKDAYIMYVSNQGVILSKIKIAKNVTSISVANANNHADIVIVYLAYGIIHFSEAILENNKCLLCKTEKLKLKLPPTKEVKFSVGYDFRATLLVQCVSGDCYAIVSNNDFVSKQKNIVAFSVAQL